MSKTIDMDSSANNQPPLSMDSLGQMFSDACQRYGDMIAFSCEGAKLSFSDLERQSNAFAAWLLRESTLEPGDRVAIQLPNLLQYPVVALGVIKAGMVIVNINPLYTAGETEHQLRDSGAKALIVLEDVLKVTGRILPGSAIERVVVTAADDMHPWHLRLAWRMRQLFVRNKARDIRFSGKTSLKDVLRRGAAIVKQQGGKLVHAEPVNLESDARLALIQYTGGTTGTAKGAMLTHDNLIANLHQIDEVIDARLPPPGSIVLAPLPFYHIYALTLNLLYSIYRGYHSVLIPDPRNTDRLVRTIKQHRIHGMVGVSTLYQVLCKHPEFQKLDFSHLQVCTSGGMALSLSTARRWEKLTGCRILEGYGLTETSPLVASGRYHDYKEGSIGKSTRWTDIRIVDEQGKDVETGQAGEILVRGPQVMVGYWRQPEETRAVLEPDGWLHTGDIGLLDESGYLTVVDRIKDMILVSGFNVYPAEIEDHVVRHPDIREAAAIGIPHQEGEYVKLFVISDNPELTENDIIQFCRQGLTPYKVPKKIEFRASLPRSNVGKVLKRQLRDDQVA